MENVDAAVGENVTEADAEKIQSVIDSASVSGVAEAVTSSGKNAIIVAAGAQTGDNALVEIEITVSVEATSADLTGANATVTYAVKNITREEIEGVCFASADYDEMVKRYDPQKLAYGFNTLPDGEEIYFIPNPALGLWIDRGRFEGQ